MLKWRFLNLNTEETLLFTDWNMVSLFFCGCRNMNFINQNLTLYDTINAGEYVHVTIMGRVGHIWKKELNVTRKGFRVCCVQKPREPRTQMKVPRSNLLIKIPITKKMSFLIKLALLNIEENETVWLCPKSTTSESLTVNMTQQRGIKISARFEDEMGDFVSTINDNIHYLVTLLRYFE